MLWYKAWLETRWRFLVGLALLACSLAGTVAEYPRVVGLIPLASSVQARGEIGRRILEAAALSREFRGYVWSQWFRQNMVQLWTIFAALLGSGGLVSGASGTLFTLSLPVSRQRLVGVRAAAGLAEVFVLALVPALLLPLMAPAVGESYRLADALVHGTCLFLGGAVFYALAVLLSSVFDDVWRPALLAIAAAVVLALAEQATPLSAHGLFGVIDGESYFRTGAVPWIGLLVSAALSAAMVSGAAAIVARRDF